MDPFHFESEESEPESKLWKSSSVSALASMDEIELKRDSFSWGFVLAESTKEGAGAGGLTDREDLA